MLDGHCLCGAVTVRAEPKDGYFTACNCENCRRWTSGISFSFVADEATAVIDGPVKGKHQIRIVICHLNGATTQYRMNYESDENGVPVLDQLPTSYKPR